MNCHPKELEAKAEDMVKLCEVCGTLLVDIEAQRELINKLNKLL